MSLKNIFRICVGFSSLALAYQLLSMGNPKSGILVILIGIFWVFGQMMKWSWISHPPFIILSLMTCRIMFSEVEPEWGLVIIIALLCAWDLESFIRRLNRPQQIFNASAIESRHLRRLFIVALLGMAAGGLILASDFKLNLVWVTILSVSAAAGLHYFIVSTKSN